MNSIKYERYLEIDQLLRDNKAKKLGKQEILNELNKRIQKAISERQFDNDINFFKNNLKSKLKEKIGVKKVYYYFRKDVSINNVLGIKSKDISVALDFIKGFRGGNDFLKIIEKEVERKFNIKSTTDQLFHFDNNYSYEKEYSEYIKIFYDAIINKHVLKVTYEDFKINEDKSDFIIHPYLIKEFNGRWYVFGFSENKSDYFHLAFDRIKKLPTIESSTEYLNKSKRINYDYYFRNRIGVSESLDGFGKEEYKIELKFKTSFFEYIRTKPLFENMNPKKSKDGMSIYVSHDMHINKELITRILSFKSNVEVIGPGLLREEIINEIDNMKNKYQ